LPVEWAKARLPEPELLAVELPAGLAGAELREPGLLERPRLVQGPAVAERCGPAA
jgi:hypothetical protein